MEFGRIAYYAGLVVGVVIVVLWLLHLCSGGAEDFMK